jgi:hypothetical protein
MQRSQDEINTFFTAGQDEPLLCPRRFDIIKLKTYDEIAEYLFVFSYNSNSGTPKKDAQSLTRILSGLQFPVTI